MTTKPTYQIERAPDANESWEQQNPIVSDEAEAVCLLRAAEIKARVNQSGERFRIVKTTKCVVRPR